MDLVHLWLHESSRVYSDKLMEEKDVELFNKILLDTGKRYFEVRSKEHADRHCLSNVKKYKLLVHLHVKYKNNCTVKITVKFKKNTVSFLWHVLYPPGNR